MTDLTKALPKAKPEAFGGAFFIIPAIGSVLYPCDPFHRNHASFCAICFRYWVGVMPAQAWKRRA